MDPICCMLFADDCVQFFEGSENVQTELKVVLQWLCDNSGQLINQKKFEIYFSLNLS